MEGQYKNKTDLPTPASPNFGTFPFFQLRKASAHRGVKGPKFTSRTKPFDSLQFSLYSFLHLNTFRPDMTTKIET